MLLLFCFRCLIVQHMHITLTHVTPHVHLYTFICMKYLHIYIKCVQ